MTSLSFVVVRIEKKQDAEVKELQTEGTHTETQVERKVLGSSNNLHIITIYISLPHQRQIEGSCACIMHGCRASSQLSGSQKTGLDLVSYRLPARTH